MKEAHKKLQQQAKQMLIDLGFREDEIFFEYRIEDLIIDCVGINEKDKVAIECGNLYGKYGKYKIKVIKKYFDKVIRLPYLITHDLSNTSNKYKTKLMLKTTDELWSRLKAKAAIEQKDLNTLILELIEKEINKKEVKKNA